MVRCLLNKGSEIELRDSSTLSQLFRLALRSHRRRLTARRYLD